MADAESSIGRLTADIEPGTLVRKTIEFVATQLPLWRDYPGRLPVESEIDLSVQLCKFLSVAARKSFFIANFLHEEPQGDFRRVDLSVSPTEPIVIGITTYSIFDPFLLIECKRLPTPNGSRQREYVFGDRGGIRRYKMAEYASSHQLAVLIAYVQSGALPGWRVQINEWIADLSASPPHECRWELGDLLESITFNAEARTSTCESTHDRNPHQPTPISLVHLWVQMYL